MTADAPDTQKATAAVIIAKGADYVLAVKDNQPELSRAVILFLDNLSQVRSNVQIAFRRARVHGTDLRQDPTITNFWE